MARARGPAVLPTRRGWGVLAVGAGTAGIWAVVRLHEVLMLAVLCLAAVLVACLEAGAVGVWARPTVRVSTSDATPTAGEWVGVVVGLRHRFPVAVPLTVITRVDQGVPARRAATVRRGRGLRMRLRIEAGPRGPHRFAVERLEAEDPLGLARLRMRAVGRTGVDLLVLPRLLGVGDLPRTGGDEGAELARPGSGEPAGNLRDYRAGDPLRLVHWKQTARQGRLLVNVPESGSGTVRTVVLVTDSEAHGGAGPTFELSVSVAATLALEWLERGEDVQIVLGSQDTAYRPGDADRVMLALAAVQTGPSGALPPLRRDALIVTGFLTPRILRSLTPDTQGTVLLTRAGAAATAPPGWRIATIGGQPDD